MDKENGFTLVELMIVISIIGILASIAIPDFTAYRKRAFFTEGYQIFQGIKKNISDFYEATGDFPQNNAQAGLPAPEKIRGKYVESTKILNGITYIKFDPELQLKKSTLIIRPAIMKGNSSSPLFFIDKPENITPWMDVVMEDNKK